MRQWFVADFETTNAKYYIDNGYTKVWLYAICDENGTIVSKGSSIEQFMQWCKENPKSDIYFHNLKFDGSFILNYLFANNYPYTPNISVKNSKGFDTLIGEEGQYYQIKVNFAINKQVTFLDSLKIIPLKVKQIAKAFKLPIQKEVIDYSNYTINETTLNYVYNDVRIVAMALKFFKNQGFDKMTIGSNAYNQCKKEIRGFKDLFPKLDREWLKVWRKAYRGGRTQVNPRYANRLMKNVNRYDINSMYPYAMSRFPMPYGEPIPISNRNQYEFELYKVQISFKLKQGHLPTLLKSSSIFSNKGDTYYIETESIEEIYISNIDFDLLEKHYDITFIEFEEMYGFRTSKHLFRKWVDKYYDLKSTAEGGLRLVYKLILNNLYGKFGSKCVGKTKIPHFDDNEGLSFTLSEEQDMSLYYLPVAIAIVSVCHKLIDDAICETGLENFVYCDTDSVHTIGTLPQHMIHESIIGMFKFEGVEQKAKYIRQKCYIYKEETHYNIVCAGMTESIKDYLVNQYQDDVFNQFKIGLKVDEHSPNIFLEDLKLRPMQVKGGTILVPTPFSLN